VDEFTAMSRVRNARSARLATADADGVPHVVPIVFAVADMHTLVAAIDHKPKTTYNLKRLRNIVVRPEVSILVDHYEDDWSRLWWVRLDGTARVEADDQLRKQHLGPLIAKYRQYLERPPRGPVIIVEIKTVRSWNADEAL